MKNGVHPYRDQFAGVNKNYNGILHFQLSFFFCPLSPSLSLFLCPFHTTSVNDLAVGSGDANEAITILRQPEERETQKEPEYHEKCNERKE